MRSKLLSGITAVFATALVFGLSEAQADPILAGFPAPGNTTLTTSGTSTGNSGGKTFNYSQNDPSQFSQLWWGPDAIGAGLNGSLTALTYSAALSNATVAIWGGVTTISSLQYSGLVKVEFVATIVGGAPGGWISAPSVGINGGPSVVADVTSGPFSVNEQFLASALPITGGNFVPFLDFFDDLNTSPTDCPPAGCLAVRSVTGEFYYNPPAAVPGPVVGAGLPGLLAACTGLLALARRRRRVAAI